MPRALSIVAWPDYEHPDTKKSIRGPMAWVKTPTAHDGLGFLTLMDHQDGLAHFGAWNLILQEAARCPTRGLLMTDGGRPILAKEMALKTRGSVKQFDQAIERLVEIGWLEWVEGRAGGDHGRMPAERSGLVPTHAHSRESQERVLNHSGDPPETITPTGQDRTGQDTPPASPPSSNARDPATTATALSRKVNGVKPGSVRDAVNAGNAMALLEAFGATLSDDRQREWSRDLDGSQLGVVALIFAWKRWQRDPIREPSGYRAAKRTWLELNRETREQFAATLLTEFGLTVAAAPSPAGAA